MSQISLLLTAKDRVSSNLRSWIPQWKSEASRGSKAISDELARGISDGIYRFDRGGRLRNARGQFVRFGDQAGQETAAGIRNSLGGISLGKLIGASAVGTIVAQGVTSAIQIGLQQLANFTTSVESTARIQTSMLSDASDLSKTLGVTMRQAKDIVGATRIEIARIAADLPGETPVYTEVFQSLASTVGELNRGNIEAFRTQILDSTKRLGFLAYKSGSSGIEAGSAVDRFVQGTATFGELRQLDVFQRNTQFQKAVRNAAAELGLDLEKGFRTASTELRFRVIDRALRTTVTDDLIKEFDGTAESYLQTLKTKLLDPDIGLFGFLRKVPVPGNQGRSVLDAVTNFLGGFTRLSEALGRAFPGVDPLLPLIQGIDILSGIVGGATLFLRSITGKDGIDFSKLNLGELIRGQIFKLEEWGRGLAEDFNKMLPGLQSWLDGIDWSRFGQKLSDLVFLALGGLGSVLATVDWGAAAQVVYTIVAGVMKTQATALGNTIGKIFDGLLTKLEEISGDSLDGLRVLGSDIARFIAKLASFFKNVPGLGAFAGALESGASAYANSLDQGTMPTTRGDNSGKRPPTSPGFSDPNPVKGLELNPRPGLSLPSFKLPDNRSLVFAPQVTVSGTQLNDPQATADLVMAKIDAQWRTFQAEKLSR